MKERNATEVEMIPAIVADKEKILELAFRQERDGSSALAKIKTVMHDGEGNYGSVKSLSFDLTNPVLAKVSDALDVLADALLELKEHSKEEKAKAEVGARSIATANAVKNAGPNWQSRRQ